jgi:hypothetical protein
MLPFLVALVIIVGVAIGAGDPAQGQTPDRWIDLRSQGLDNDTRLKLVWQIQKQLEADVARPMLGWRKEYGGGCRTCGSTNDGR